MTSTRKMTGLKRAYSRCEHIPILGPFFSACRLVVAHGDVRGAARSLRASAKQAYVQLEGMPIIAWLFRKSRRLSNASADFMASILLYLRSPRHAYWRLRHAHWWLVRRQRKMARIATMQKLSATKLRQLGQTGYLYPYEFDTAIANFADIKSIIEHHERSKPLASTFYRALYDLRSGLLLHRVRAIEDALKHHVKSFGLELERFAPYQLLRSSCADIDARKQSIEFLQSATRHNPSLGEAYYQLGVIYRVENRLTEALPCLQAAARLPPTMLQGSHELPLSVRAYYEAGLVLRDLKRFDEALVSFEKAVELAPEFSDAHRMLGEELRRAGRYAQAAEYFHRAMFYRPVVPLLPSLPPRLAPAPGSDAAKLSDPEIAGILLDRPVVLPAISIELHRGFRVFKLFGQIYGIPEGDGPIDYPGLVARDHVVMFVDSQREKVIRSVNEFLDG
jgi:tetratricopeptide (TPR) repeat protein